MKKTIKTTIVALLISTSASAKTIKIEVSNPYKATLKLELQKRDLARMISIQKKFLTKKQKETLKLELKALK